MKIHTLRLTYGTSRGRDTYGYALVTLRDENGKAWRTCGGGYDMKGTVFGDWLQDTYQAELRAIAHRAHAHYGKAGGYQTHDAPGSRNPDFNYLYGMLRNDDTGEVRLDGACGLSCMEGIAGKIGLTVNSFHDRKGNTDGWSVLAPGRVSAA